KHGDSIPGAVPPECGRSGEPAGPISARLGTVDSSGSRMTMMCEDPITENPGLGVTEVWEIHNFTEDAHPIHLHSIQFQVVDRTPMGSPIGGSETRGPEPWETGFKDTVEALPEEVTRI